LCDVLSEDNFTLLSQERFIDKLKDSHLRLLIGGLRKGRIILRVYYMQDFIKLRGVRVHNLKNVDLDIPKNKLVVITGVSGSGKSSLAFDTIYAESERRYLESLSGYARQFLGVKDKPDYDKIEGLSPAIAINQRNIAKNPRSTVATITEIYDYLRILFARTGDPFCPNCQIRVSKQTHQSIIESILKIKKTSDLAKETLVLILAPIIENKKGEHKGVLTELSQAGFSFVRFDKILWRLEELLQKEISKVKKHTIELVLDRLVLGEEWEKTRLSEAVERALKTGKGFLKIGFLSKIGRQISDDVLFSEKFACPKCGMSFPEIEPRIFSFNNPYGACSQCTGLGYLIKVDPELLLPNKNLTLAEGAIAPSLAVGQRNWQWYELVQLSEKLGFSLKVPVKDLSKRVFEIIMNGTGRTGPGDEGIDFEGVIPNLERKWKDSSSDYVKAEIEKYMSRVSCSLCHGQRLNSIALAVRVKGKNINDIVSLSISEAFEFFNKLKFSEKEKIVTLPLIKEIQKRLEFMIEIGLDYLTLDRESTTLAGGESQRIRLATQIGSGLSGVIYVLDEPSIGMHPRDIGRLIKNLRSLRDLGNTVIVVEHDEQTIRAADWVVDVGPGAGERGGKIVFEGEVKKLESSNSRSKTLTGEYLSGKRKVQRKINQHKSALNQHKSAFLEIIGASQHNLKDVSVKIPTGRLVSVTGVSGSGKSSLIIDTLAPALLRHFYHSREPIGKHKEIKGIENLDKVSVVDQSPIGRTPRSNPATYTGMFDFIRDIFSQTKISRMRGYDKGRFSFNLKGGRCDACEGQGYQKIEMYFLPDVYVECDECRGTRYRNEILEIEHNGKNIAEVLKMSVLEARMFFKHFPQLEIKLRLLEDVGLGYLKLGQSATTLSGGEAQRIKLSSELSKRQTGKSLYILDEPTTGLHFDDCAKLLGVLDKLVEKGNTVLVVEHELDIIRNSDWIIDLGPEGGDGGGQVIAAGTPNEIKKNKKSYTGKYL